MPRLFRRKNKKLIYLQKERNLKSNNEWILIKSHTFIMSLSIIKLRIHIAAFTIVIYLYLSPFKILLSNLFNFPLNLPNAFSTRILCYDKLNSSAEVKGGLANIDLQMRIFFFILQGWIGNNVVWRIWNSFN